MEGTASDTAFSRIDAAIARIEAALARPSRADPASDSDLASRHEQLRAAVAESLRSLDSLIMEQQP
jgi:hypothetical protein